MLNRYFWFVLKQIKDIDPVNASPAYMREEKLAIIVIACALTPNDTRLSAGVVQTVKVSIFHSKFVWLAVVSYNIFTDDVIRNTRRNLQNRATPYTVIYDRHVRHRRWYLAPLVYQTFLTSDTFNMLHYASAT